MNQPLLTRAGIITLCVCAAICAQPRAAWSQVAKVTVVMHVVQHAKTGAAWTASKVGTQLGNGDKVRTGQRSKAEVRFDDKSVVRLAALSDIVVRAGKDISLNKGKIFGNFKSPGKIKSGSVVANVKGTTFTLTRLPDGSFEIILYDGGLSIDTPLGSNEFNVQPGGQPQKIIIPPQPAPEDVEEGVEEGTGIIASDAPDSVLIDPDIDVPPPGTTVYETPGSNTQLNIKEGTLQINDGAKKEDEKEAGEIIQQTGIDFVDPPPPPPLPDPGDETGGIGVIVKNIKSHVQANPGVARVVCQKAQSFNGAIPMGLRDKLRQLKMSGFQIPPNTADIGLRSQTGTGDSAAYEAGKSGGKASTSALASATMGALPQYFAPHIDAELSAFVFEGGSSLGGRTHVNGMNDGYYWDFAVAPTTLFENGVEADLTDAFVARRTEELGTFIAGRQRFLKGPVQNTIFGTLIRQFGRDIQDAVTWIAPPMIQRSELQLSYLVDAYPSGLPTAVSGLQGGWYARLSYQTPKFGNFALNLSNDEFSDHTGMTVDFGVPLLPNEIDLYGEVGWDNFNGNIRTFGLYFGGLFQRYGVDMFLEHAALNRTINGTFVPTETLLRVYRKFTDQYSAVLLVDKKSGSNVDLGIGVVSKLPQF
ncbi:MAG: hypothetical protein AUJ92_14505 [Armatimonadetes bacterium CG2_30_59_28]|nr:FecR domain-containing protein [Armatimonadota bacterium]OIO92271.1 MAG: hypothetical protein AUJ92_14505 [Armatimonadetes bacterium CG2_30_59_28]PIU65324.1 MAG: hypothetical protein COS85_09405 [Armatimonadetes bacterium CG07_land_8_20_14_0_80_59_28]PIY40679.1 MAG: hypothetical protein COZ05_17160 [Armatimonadetes bacterium CG_4_10_14_3_um_filter_59_10]